MLRFASSYFVGADLKAANNDVDISIEKKSKIIKWIVRCWELSKLVCIWFCTFTLLDYFVAMTLNDEEASSESSRSFLSYTQSRFLDQMFMLILLQRNPTVLFQIIWWQDLLEKFWFLL